MGDSTHNYCTECADIELIEKYFDLAPKQRSVCALCNNIGPWITDASILGFNHPTCPTCASDILHFGIIKCAYGDSFDGKLLLNEAGAVIFT
jgi:hypothetical protein